MERHSSRSDSIRRTIDRLVAASAESDIPSARRRTALSIAMPFAVGLVKCVFAATGKRSISIIPTTPGAVHLPRIALYVRQSGRNQVTGIAVIDIKQNMTIGGLK